MKALLLGVALHAAVASTSLAAGAFHLEPAPQPGEVLSFIDGHAAMLSKGTTGSAVLLLRADTFAEGDMPMFSLGVENRGTAPINLTPADVVVSTDAGPLRVMTVGDLQLLAKADVDRQVKAARWRAFGAALGGAGAAMQSSSGSYDATATTFGNTTTVNGSYTPPRNNYYAQQAAAQGVAQARADADQATASLPEGYSVAETFGFRPSTIAPAGQAFSPMPIEKLPRKATKLTVTVSVNGEPHVFEYVATRSGR